MAILRCWPAQYTRKIVLPMTAFAPPNTGTGRVTRGPCPRGKAVSPTVHSPAPSYTQTPATLLYRKSQVTCPETGDCNLPRLGLQKTTI